MLCAGVVGVTLAACAVDEGEPVGSALSQGQDDATGATPSPPPALGDDRVSPDPVGAGGAGEDPAGGSSGAGTSSSGDGTSSGGTSSGGTSSGATSSSGGSSSGAASSSGGTSSSSGGSSSGGTSSSSSGGPSSGGTCSVVQSGGATGEGGVIPVCCAPTGAEKAEIDEVFLLLNAYRAQMGKAALTYDPKLEASIQGHCQHMTAHGFFDHTAPEAAVKTPFVRAPLCGATANAENLAAGQRTPAAVMASWKGSAGHNANMLGSYARVGICRSGSYWGQLFGK